MSTWGYEINRALETLKKHPSWSIREAICHNIEDCTFFVGTGIEMGVLEILPKKELKKRVKNGEYDKDDDEKWNIIMERLKKRIKNETHTLLRHRPF